MRDIFEIRETKGAVGEKNNINLEIPRVNQASFDTKSLRFKVPRYGILSHIPINLPKIQNVLKMSFIAGMVPFVVVEKFGSSTTLN